MCYIGVDCRGTVKHACECVCVEKLLLIFMSESAHGELTVDPCCRVHCPQLRRPPVPSYSRRSVL